MKQYLDLLQKILDDGETRDDRTGTGTKSVFGHQMRFNLKEGFPLVTTKKVSFTGVVDELLWFLSGSTNVYDLPERSRYMWSKWSDNNGDLGPIYGEQWRNWYIGHGIYFDQIQLVIDSIKNRPHSRRHIVSAWNLCDLPDETLSPKENFNIGLMALAPCHALFQFYVGKNGLSCQLYQRSADVFLGLPFNIANYALLTHMIAQQCNLEVNEFIWTGGDVHLYLNHIEQAQLQLTREPMPLPTLNLDKRDSIDNYVFEDIQLIGYESHPAIRAEVSV